MSMYVKDLLVQKLAETKAAITSSDTDRVKLEELLKTNKDQYLKLVDEKTALVEQLKSIDPEGVYE